MLKHFMFAAALLFALSAAPQSTNTVNIDVPRTLANDGRQMYVSYCASCHGLSGRGNGPAAGVLRVPPSDLTVLSKSNQGKFPGYRVASVLRFGPESPKAHGLREMPVWGSVFAGMNHTVMNSREEEDLRVTNLSRYLEGIQAK
jgi:mono/diheme cytochrome c family protein